MNRINTVMIGTCVLALFCGCAARRAARAGFLSDYSKLQAKSEVSYRYLAPGGLSKYSKFIIDPVTIHLHGRSKAKEKTSEADRTDMKNYMNAALIKAIGDGYEIVHRPGQGVARIRVALTDIKKAQVLLNIHPASKLMGAGLGGVSLEGEILDSETREQIAALVESQLGDRLSFAGLSSLGDAKAIMDDWAQRTRDRIDEAHGIQK